MTYNNIMVKEVMPIDLFEIADKSTPPDFDQTEWERLAGPIYGEMRSGISAFEIWRAVSLELDFKSDVYAPYLAAMIVSINNLFEEGGMEMTSTQLSRAGIAPIQITRSPVT